MKTICLECNHNEIVEETVNNIKVVACKGCGIFDYEKYLNMGGF